jgi:hypothetical protein
MKHLLVLCALLGTGLMHGLMSHSAPVFERSPLRSHRTEAKDLGGLLYCCGGPVCIPHEPCGPGHVSFRGALPALRLSERSSTANTLSTISHMMTNGSAEFCCGGPVCIPNEPCGSGGYRIAHDS